jgi:hypothetical protein
MWAALAHQSLHTVVHEAFLAGHVCHMINSVHAKSARRTYDGHRAAGAQLLH